MGKNGEVVGYGEKEDVGWDGERRDLRGDVVDGVVKGVEVGVWIGDVWRGEVEGLGLVVEEFEFGGELVKVVVEWMDVGDIGSVVEIGGRGVGGKGEGLELRVEEGEGIRELEGVRLGVVDGGGEFVVDEKLKL